MELLHKLATEVKLDFIEAVDQRYTHTSSIITTQQGTDIVVPNVELLGRAKITGPSRYTEPFNTIAFSPSSHILYNMLNSSILSPVYTKHMYKRGRDLHSFNSNNKDKTITFDKTNRAHTLTSDIDLPVLPERVQNSISPGQFLVAKDAIANDDPIGIYDVNGFYQVVASPPHSRDKSPGGNITKDLFVYSAMSADGPNFGEMLTPHYSDQDIVVDDKLIGLNQELVQAIYKYYFKYNKLFETRNYGIKELSRAASTALHKMSRMIDTNAETPQELEDKFKCLTVLSSAIPAFNKSMRKVPTTKVLRDEIHSLKWIDDSSRLGTEDASPASSPIMSVMADLFPVRDLLSVRSPLFGIHSISDIIEACLTEFTPLAKICNGGVLNSQLTLNTNMGVRLINDKILLTLIGTLFSSIYYTMRYPNLKGKLKENLSAPERLLVNSSLYNSMLGMLKQLFCGYKNIYLPEILGYVYVKYGGDSKEFEQFLREYAKVIAVNQCIYSRVKKLNIAKGAYGLINISGTPYTHQNNSANYPGIHTNGMQFNPSSRSRDLQTALVAQKKYQSIVQSCIKERRSD